MVVVFADESAAKRFAPTTAHVAGFATLRSRNVVALYGRVGDPTRLRLRSAMKALG
jgi:hypothetical protein